jgi:hypothetical protein
MTNDPQAREHLRAPVRNSAVWLQSWGWPKAPPTRRDGQFSPIHTPYYCYSRFS